MTFPLRIALAFLVLIGVGLLFTFQRPPTVTVQRGYRGDGQDVTYNAAVMESQIAANKVPDPEAKQDPAGQPSSKVYQNVKVLGAVDANEFLRDMAAITTWVAPTQGCTYCHSSENLAWDTLYTKIVARRMLQMTEHINSEWKTHVGAVGVTCYTCHRGNPVPRQIWFHPAPPAQGTFNGLAEVNKGKNLPSVAAGLASLPYDPFTPFLEQDNNIRIAAQQALPGSDYSSIKQTDWTYALMMHFANALGVNCDYCHNSRAFSDWSQSSPARVNAWYGIRMVRDLNNNYLGSLQDVFPKARLGPMGDVAKVNCSTCHQGIYKPLFGVSMVKDYPELGDGGQVDTAADIGTVGDYTKP